MIKIFKYILVSFFCVSILSGCFFGYANFSKEECVSDDPAVIWGVLDPNKSNQESIIDGISQPTKADCLSKFGKPDEIVEKDSYEVIWVYKKNYWCGYVPILGIPYPFIAPVCEGYVRISFENDIARLINFTITDIDGYVTGISGGNEFNTGICPN